MSSTTTADSAVRTIAGLWPAKDHRHHAYLALSGGLLRAGWPVEHVESLIDALAVATSDEERSQRVAVVQPTAEKIQQKKPASGWPNLAKLLKGGWFAVAALKHSLGLSYTLAELAEAKRLPVDFLESLGVRDREGGGVEIDYLDQTGRIVATRTRENLSARPKWVKGQSALIYGEDRLQDSVAAGHAVLVEGESDCWTLWHHGEPALGIPGSECAKVLQEGHVAQLPRLYVYQEPHQSGEAFVDGVRRRLAALGWTGELRRIHLDDHKDPSALHIADPERFAERWQAAMEQADRLELPPAASATCSLPAEPPWPAALAEEAHHGLAGEIVRALEPASEADPAALLIQILVGFGNLLGRTALYRVEADKHFGNEYAVLVGKTSKARKGTSWGRVNRLLNAAEEQWANERIQTGLSSGEGLIWAVRDPVEKMERVKERGQPVRYEKVEADPGIADKRLLVVEPEYANVLKQTERQGNTLSAILRQAWESGDLRTLTKNSPAKSTGAHISLLGHITTEELRRYLTTTEMANGFGNRHLWLCVRRSKELPEGGAVDEDALTALQTRLAEALAFARQQGEMRRDDAAREIWREVYSQLSADRPGLSGALLGRAEAHVLRLSMLYALLDSSASIQAPHLMAALALWDFCEQSVRHIWGDALGDPVADELLRLLRASVDGVTRNQICDHFGRNHSSDRIGKALSLLAEHRFAQVGTQRTGGRSREVWKASKR
ncbi:MAG TPA: hypothetical protein VH643_28395 [Gemmataceae bacterium]